MFALLKALIKMETVVNFKLHEYVKGKTWFAFIKRQTDLLHVMKEIMM
jgi:hypothetical protein